MLASSIAFASTNPQRLLAPRAFRVALALAATALAWTLSLLPFFRTLELKTYDLRTRATAQPSASHPSITLVSVTDDSVRRMEPLFGRWPWPRLVHASLIDFLARAPAKLIVYDILFTEADHREFLIEGDRWTGAESDQVLADSVAAAGTVVLAADVADLGLVDERRNLQAPIDEIPAFNRGYRTDQCLERRPVLGAPIPSLARAARAVGHSLTHLDDDGPVRRTTPFVGVQGRALPSLALAAAREIQGWPPASLHASAEGLRLGDLLVPLQPVEIASFYGPATSSCRMLIPYRGPSRTSAGVTTFREFSFYDLYLSEQQLLAGVVPAVDPSAFKDRVVVLGTTASGTYDVLPVPFAGGMAGSEIHANVLDSLISGRHLRELVPAASVLLTFAVAAAIVLAGAWLSARAMALVASLAAGLLIVLSLPLFAGGLSIPLVAPSLAIALAYTGDLAWKYFVEGREKRQVKTLFSRYVSKDVYERLLADPSRAELGGVRRRMTVLFSDVRGFTSLSEAGEPEALVRQLNEYFSEMVRVLLAHRGTLDKFVGDMVMALFGAPLDDPEHADHAVETALAMSEALDRLNARWAAEGRPALDIGIGINTGEMIAGNIGSSTIMSYTVIGDAVNLGARLEALNKDYNSRIVISEHTRAALTREYDLRALGAVVVKGKSQAVEIFEVRPRRPASA